MIGMLLSSCDVDAGNSDSILFVCSVEPVMMEL